LNRENRYPSLDEPFCDGITPNALYAALSFYADCVPQHHALENTALISLWENESDILHWSNSFVLHFFSNPST